MNTWKVVLVGIILSTGVASARPESDRAVATGAAGEPNGTLRAFQTDPKDKVLSMTLSGQAAEYMYNMLAHGEAAPDVVPKERPKPVSKNGIHCGLSTDPRDRDGTYLCHFAVTSAGFSTTYKHKLVEEKK